MFRSLKTLFMRYRNNKKDKQEQIRLKITEVQIRRLGLVL